MVRISYLKRVFNRGFNQQWTDEIFKIKARMETKPYTYKLQDFDGDDISGTFYEPELVKVTPTKNPVYRIEKVILSRKVRGKVQYLVKWQGWPNKFNSYVSKKELTNFMKKK